MGSSGIPGRKPTSSFLPHPGQQLCAAYSTCESREAYHQRTTDITIIETGEAVDVTTYIMMAPTTYGQGTGPFNRYSIQLPAMMPTPSVLGVAGLRVNLLQKICTEVEILSGRRGIYFCETGEHTHREFSERLAKAAHVLGMLPTAEVKEITLAQAGERLAPDSVSRAELSFAANARIKAVLGRKLGWTPLHGEEWETTLKSEDWQACENNRTQSPYLSKCQAGSRYPNVVFPHTTGQGMPFGPPLDLGFSGIPMRCIPSGDSFARGLHSENKLQSNAAQALWLSSMGADNPLWPTIGI
ncbi:hypothetical protein ASPACDRAFT_1857410 [Aspergillus aculeatus ATCC 16872]|uniref:NmrA-like domain-containing protein n=1 Tax=Aspergillus aculeatus (strain ATCC 16872 / CBS 172.66 / WB 5094) TaxID=690307 RepID=A0A1L9WRX0_ASPA1|nr:uncharacterized protein ASPACDRAFT_1857410 [Aspergillus aculeatus ATCC 16872]OJJ98931.1 hypothetical protein ASPACDRAFT_1857410 [Aspergillus aculeatus ATCC 16872]